MQERRKPLGMKNYGHIAHLPGSRMGPGDHTCEAGQARIATLKARDRHDHIIVQEKLDGTNVGVARLDGALYPLVRAGYVADTSPFEQHWRFAQWVYANQDRFLAVLRDGERLVGEWLMQAHGTRYQLKHEPFGAFDLMARNDRARYDELIDRVRNGDFVAPTVIHRGEPLSIEAAMKALDTYGFHGASDPVEGAVWRIERNELVNPGKNGERRWTVDFLVKYVRPHKTDGVYLPEISGRKPVWNWRWKKARHEPANPPSGFNTGTRHEPAKPARNEVGSSFTGSTANRTKGDMNSSRPEKGHKGDIEGIEKYRCSSCSNGMRQQGAERATNMIGSR